MTDSAAPQGQMLEDVLGLPEQLRDALWRVESARPESSEQAGLLVCGMGGSAIGADLAAAALGERLRRPLATVRGYALPGWASAEWAVLSCSYSGNTEETVSCFRAAGELGARRLAVSTGGTLTEEAREAGVPVIGMPGIFQPRAAVAYLLTATAEVAALTGVAPRVAGEIEAAADFLASQSEQLRHLAAEVAASIGAAAPVVYGADLTVPVARRWKTQVNENAKLHAFFSGLPEADHNEICAWNEAGAVHGLAGVFLEDRDQHPRVGRRFDLTAAELERGGAVAVRVETAGESRVERLLWAVMLGDLVSLELAGFHGVDPIEIEAIQRLKEAMAE